MIIYKHTSPSGKSYIGQTMYTIDERFKQHIRASNNGSELMFHQAIRKYGYENFSSEIVEVCENDIELNEREIYWIRFYDTYKNGYNMTEGGGIPWNRGKNGLQTAWNKGITMTEDQKKNMGHAVDNATKEKISKTKTGTKLSEAHKQAISEACSGEKNGMYGKKHSEKTKKILSKKATGRKWTQEQKEERSKMQKGKKRGPYKKQLPNGVNEG